MFLKFFNNRFFFAAFLLILFQQVIVGLSNVFIFNAINQPDRDHAMVSVSYYFMALLLPYLFGSLGLYMAKRWELNIWSKQLETWRTQLKGLAVLWNNNEMRDKTVQIISKEFLTLTHLFTSQSLDTFSILLNVLINSIFVGFLFDNGLLAILVVAFLVCSVIYKKSIPLLQKASENSQNIRIGFFEKMQGYGDNVILGNNYNYDTYRPALEGIQNLLTVNEVKLVKKNIGLSLSLTFMSFLPVICYSYWSLWNLNPLSFKGALVLLPRLFMILTNVAHLLEIGSQWPSILSQINICYKKIAEGVAFGNSSVFEKRVKENEIQIIYFEDGRNYQSISIEELWTRLHDQKQKDGRYCIRGKNGAGKSSLLNLIKYRLPETSFLFPTHHKLAFPGEAPTSESLSSGKKTLHFLEKLFLAPEPILLLDEWDANLDDQNKKELDVQIEALSRKRIIVEVRHGYSKGQIVKKNE